METITWAAQLILNFWIWTIILAIFLLYWVKWLKLWLIIYKKKNNIVDLDLRNHDLFPKLYYWIVDDIENLSFEDSYESKLNICKDFLKLKFYVRYIDLKALIIDNENKLNKLSSSELYNLIFLQFSKTLHKYEFLLNKLWIPKLWIHKFNYWHKSRLKLVEKNIERIVNSDYYSNEIKIQIIFDNYIKEFEWTLFDARHTLSDINWELKHIKYKQKLNTMWNLKKLLTYYK